MVSGRMIGSLIGAFGGRAVGGMLGGGTGRMVGSLLGSMVGSRGISGGLGSAVGGLGGLLGGGDKDEPIEIPDEQAVVLIRAMTNAAKAVARSIKKRSTTSFVGPATSKPKMKPSFEPSSPLP